jgi:hypothetical protein
MNYDIYTGKMHFGTEPAYKGAGGVTCCGKRKKHATPRII